MSVNLYEVSVLWARKCVPLIEATDDVVCIDIEDGQQKAREKAFIAAVGRDLLELADTLELMSQMVRQEYWGIKDRGVVVEIGRIDG